MSRKLVVSDGKRDRELQLVGRLVVGRDPACDISHDHALLSRRHAEFITAGETVTVRDLGSRNGVFVNGARIAEQTLDPGDIVQIGPLRAKYVTDAAALSIAPEEMDADRTVVIREPSPAGAARTALDRPADPPDDDVTRLVRGPRLPPPSPRPTPPVDDDADRTGFIPAPAAAMRLAVAEAAAAPAPAVTPSPAPAASGLSSTAILRPSSIDAAPPAAADTPAPTPSLAPFVFAQVTVLAALVAAAGVAAAYWRGSAVGTAPMVPLTLPIAVAAVGAYVVGSAINRKVTGALASALRNRIRG